MTIVEQLAGGAVFWSLALGGVLIEKWWQRRSKRAATPEPPKPPGPWSSLPGPVREPEPPRLDPAELAALAHLAVGRAGADPRPALWLADYLRRNCPGISDIDVMRVMRALGSAAHVFRRHEPGDTAAFDKYLSAMGGAALELTALDRTEIPS